MLAKGYGFIYDQLNRLTTSRYGEGASCTSNVGRYDENLTFKYILTPEGRATYSSGAYTYEYFMKDHLGNTRISFNVPGSTAVIVQQSDYYPYGMTHRPRAVTTSDNRYLFNGKELQNNLLGGVNLDWYDYGARFYDPQIGKTPTIDPHADSYFSESPYSFMGNEPVLNIDPDGMDWYTNWFTGNQVWFDGSDKHLFYSHNEGGYYSSPTVTVTDYSNASIYKQAKDFASTQRFIQTLNEAGIQTDRTNNRVETLARWISLGALPEFKGISGLLKIIKGSSKNAIKGVEELITVANAKKRVV